MTNVNAAAVEQNVSTNARPMPPGRMLIDVKIVAAKYGADERSIFRWADAGKILCRVVGQVGIDRRIHRMSRRMNQECVAIGVRLGDTRGRNCPTCAGTIVDHHRLSQGLR